MKRFVVVSIVIALVLAGCAKEGAVPAAKDAAGNAEFAKFVDEYFAWSHRTSPTSATYDGIHDYDGELVDFSREAVEARIVDLHGFLERVEGFDRASLSFDEQIDADALEGRIRGSLLDTLETLRIWETNPML